MDESIPRALHPPVAVALAKLIKTFPCPERSRAACIQSPNGTDSFTALCHPGPVRPATDQVAADTPIRSSLRTRTCLKLTMSARFCLNVARHSYENCPAAALPQFRRESATV